MDNFEIEGNTNSELAEDVRKSTELNPYNHGSRSDEQVMND